MRDTERIARLVREAQTGDEHAFAALVAAFQDIAVAYATSILRDYHLGEDAAQEAFLDAYRALPSLREPRAFPSWFRRIVFKQCDRIARPTRRALDGLSAALDVSAPGPSALESLERREDRQALRDAIRTLTEAERRVVLLFYMGDQSQGAIAEFLGVTANAVKTRLYSARRRLRAHMSDIEKDLGETRPSADNRFAEAVRRMIQPEALKQKHPWLWSSGIGTDVWEMFCACMVGDLPTVKALVAKDPSLVRSHYEYRTPLSFAVRENRLDVAEFLLDQGAARIRLGDPIQMAKDRGHTEMAALLERKMATLHGASAAGEPVAAAIRAGDVATVRRLLDESPELLHAGDAASNQPIHWAVMTRQPELIDELLERGADIEAPRADGARPIHLTNGDYSFRGWRDVPSDRPSPDVIYRRLVDRGASVDVWMAALKGSLDRVRALIGEDPSLVNATNEYNSYYGGSGTALSNAAAAGHLDIVRLLLDRGANPNLPQEGIAPRGSALYNAVFHDHYEIAKLLLEHGAYPNQPVESSADAVWIAIRDGKTRFLQLLASHGAVWDIPNGDDAPLRYPEIVATGLARPMRMLAHYGDLTEAARRLEVDPSLADDPAVLEAAAGRGHEDFVRLLLRYRPETAKRVRVTKPREIAELLFAHGMDPNRPNWMRTTPLHQFAREGAIDKAALYLDHGADLEARDAELISTPLGWAAEAGRLAMVEFLLRRGAKVAPDGGPPWTKPVAWAQRRGYDAIVKLLDGYERTGRLPRRTVAEYRDLAADLARAVAGDAAALARIADRFRLHRALLWDNAPFATQVERLRRMVQERLGGDAGRGVTREDAQELVARVEGYADWAELTKKNDAE